MSARAWSPVITVIVLSGFAAGPVAAQSSDPFQSAPVAAPPRPAPAPRPRPPRREPEIEPSPVIAPAPRPAPAPASFVGTWQGQVYQFPFTLVVQADNGQTMTVQWRGSRIVAGRVVYDAPETLTARRGGDGSFSVVNPSSDNRIDNARWCGQNLCATFYLRSADSHVPVVFRRTQ